MVGEFDMKLTQKLLKEYRKASKKEKGKIIDQYIKITKVKRKTAIKRFNRAVKNPYPRILKKVKIKKKRGPKVKYGYIQKQIIKECWELSGRVCAEKLHPMLEVYIQQLKDNFKIGGYPPSIIETTKKISVATLKRILSEFKIVQKSKRNKGNHTLYKYIPIIANFGKYAHTTPGLIEVDFVTHTGSRAEGKYAITGCFVDIYSQWIVRVASLGKNQASMQQIVDEAHKRIYHPIHHYHPDNDRAILKVLFERVQKQKDDKKSTKASLNLSRSRPYQKNDNAHVEQKNYDKVRRLVGYYRYDTQEEVEMLNQIYEISDLIDNFFIASFKLKEKIIDNKGKVIKKLYDKPKTPYQRLKESSLIDKKVKEKLDDIYNSLNLVKLRDKLNELLKELFKLQKMKKRQGYVINFGDKKYELTKTEKTQFRRHLIMS